MPESPGFSDKAGVEIMGMIRPAVPSFDKLTPTARLKQTTAHEPSPASTRGDSATDSSNPATPQDGAVRDLTSNMSDLLTAQVPPSPESKLVHGSNCLMLVERDSQRLVAQSSPSKSIDHEISNPLGSTNSSPNTDRLEKVLSNPIWRIPHDDSFVRSSGTKDDPFVANSPTVQLSSKDSTIALYRVREDRAGDLPTPGTAQAHFDPDACVFVANLLQTATDQQLESAVTASFSQFGRVYVKIRRDSRGMPFAFAQYETEGEAQHAVTEGRNIPIMGRHCRTEIARVNRTLYLSRISGGDISHEEARQILNGYGAIEELHHASSAERALYGLPQGIFVRFHFYDDCRDAQIKFRIHDGYRLEQARVPEDMRVAPRRQALATGAGYSNVTPPRYSPRSPISMRLRFDDRSIFVGNLPCSVNEQRIREHFSRFGLIHNVVLCLKQSSTDAAVLTVFCFVEYSTRSEADAAVQQASRWFDGFQLRIEHKVSRRLPISQAGSPSGNDPPPSNNTLLPTQAHDILMTLYQRGIEVGMNQAVQAQTMASQVILPPVYASYPQPYYPHYDSTLGMYPNGAPQNYGIGVQSYNNSNITSTMGQTQYTQTTGPTPYIQYEQTHSYTNPATAENTPDRNGESPYVWPMPIEGSGAKSSRNIH